MIDTHCHLTFQDFSPPHGTKAVLDRARGAGVTGCITISTTTRDCLDALAIARAHDRVWCTAGVHPLYSDDGPHDWAHLKVCARDAKCVAWGELGLDNHYDDPPAKLQRDVLDEQLAFLQSCQEEGIDKPIVIHCREAFADLIPVLSATKFDPARFVFHCFTGTPSEARAVLDFGAHISFTGVVTYKNAPDVREAASLVPLERMMIETDAPFLSPNPHRGTRPCEPWMASLTARAIAEIRGMPFEAFHEAINATTARFFGIDAG